MGWISEFRSLTGELVFREKKIKNDGLQCNQEIISKWKNSLMFFKGISVKIKL